MKLVYTLLLFLFISLAHAQLENSQWRFSGSCGISFTNSPPAIVNSNISGGGGSCSSIADASGNLLFYTDGTFVYNKQNLMMAGGSNPLQGSGTTQGVLIVKQPGNNNLYYIFSAGYSGLRYSIVDMNLASGNGSVTVQNVLITTQSQAYKIAGTRHCNKTDIWIVSQDYNVSTWRSYLFTSTGLSNAVISSTGYLAGIYAAMKFSPDGSKIATSEWGDGIYLHDFNNSTGAVSGGTVVSGQGLAAWGVEFSPNGKILYGTRSTASVFQWDLTAGSATAIAASTFTVFPASGPGFSSQGALQLAVDGKIYQSYSNGNALSVIHNPNALGAACTYSYLGFSTFPHYVGYGLPNNVKPNPPLPGISAVPGSSACLSMQFSITTTSLSGINSIIPNNVTWWFGDPPSGPANTSTLFTPLHVYSSPGTYTVKLILQNQCTAPDTVSQVVNVTNSVSPIAFAGNTLLCMGETTTLNVSGAGTYTWTSPLGTSTGSSLVVSPTTSMAFTVQAQNGSACITNSVITVTILPPSVFSVSGNTLICAGQPSSLTASGVSTYTWLGPAGPLGNNYSLTVNPPAGLNTYTLVGSNPSLTCVGQLPFSVTVTPNPSLMVMGPTQVCAGDAFSLLATGATNYTWTYAGGAANGPILSTTAQGPVTYSIVGSNPNQPACVGQTTYSLTVNLCLGLMEGLMERVSLFPNPCTDYIRVSSDEDLSICIMDLQGRVVKSFSGRNVSGTYDVRELSKGFYMAEIRQQETVYYQRLVKE